MTSIRETLAQYGQDHLIRHLETLTHEHRSRLEEQLADVDFAQLQRLTQDRETHIDWAALAARAEPPAAVRLDQPHPQWSSQAAIAAGETALRSGRIGLILVAGGQGTRLGFDQPKGVYPIAPLSGRTLFQMHCDRLLAIMKRYQTSIPLYVMTSSATDQATRKYFEEHQRCGLAEDQLIIFCQGSMPAVDAQTGRVLLASNTQIALSPDGHGGVLQALQKNGCLDDARQRGIERFCYAQVDNPLAQLCDPELIGYHILSGSPMTTQVVRKRFAEEKVGNVVQIEGQVQIIEYSDLPDSAAQRTNPDGSLVFWAGNIAIHVFDREFLESVVRDANALPFHRAHKSVPYIDEQGQRVEPEQPNAIKFERFVFDLLPLAEGAIVVEGDAAQVFAPVKNADGAAVDTPTTAQMALSGLHRSWLEAAGARVSADVQVEIHPAWALDAADVQRRIQPGMDIVQDTYFAIE